MYNIIILGLTSLLTDISSEMVYPLIPLYLTAQLGATPAIVGLIEGIAESLASLLKVFSGYWSDKMGSRKPLAIAGYSSSTLGKIFLFFSTSWSWVLWGRVADRFGKGIRTAPRDALIAESSNPEKLGRAYGLHRAMDTLGASIGVILGYYFLTTYRGDFRQVFLFALIPAVLGVAVLFLAREQKREAFPNRRPPSLNWWALDARLRAFLVVVFLFTLGNSSNQFLLLRAKNLGFSDSTVILLYLTYNLVYSIFSYPAGRVSDRLGRRSVLVAGHLAYALVYLGFAVVSHPTALWYLFGLYGLYSAFTEGVEKALVAEIAPSEQKATLIGLHATLVGIGLLPASLLAGLLWNLFGPRAPFYFGSLMAALAAVGLYLVLGG
ncbi:MAG: MFS transporter, partial [Desulfofundulus sp.]